LRRALAATRFAREHWACINAIAATDTTLEPSNALRVRELQRMVRRKAGRKQTASPYWWTRIIKNNVQDAFYFFNINLMQARHC
jgi:hypothetical protein